MAKERDSKTIEADMKKCHKALQKDRSKMLSLNAELTAAKKREKAQRQQAIGAAIEEVLGIGALSEEDLAVLIYCFKRELHFKNGSVKSVTKNVAKEILKAREKVTAAQKASSNEDGSADQKPIAVPTARQGFDGGETGRSLPVFPSQSPDPTSI